MPGLYYTGLPEWLQWVLILGALAAALVGIIALFRKVWTIMNLFITRINSLDDLPQFMVTTAVSLAAQDVKIEQIHREVNYNGESSVKDAVRRVELGVKGIYERLDTADAVADELRHDLEITRPHPIRKRPTKPKETS